MRLDRTVEPEFQQLVTTLRVPEMGTDVVAPLLVNLLHMLRPQRVLEVGMGYTTPFLATALADIREQSVAEARGLAAKTARHRDAGLDDGWLNDEPALAAPSFHLEPYAPRLVAVDDLSNAFSSADRVLEVLRELRVDDLVTVVNADVRDCAEKLPPEYDVIDLAWVDAWECLYFFDHFWERINPDGGVLLMHYLMTYPEGEAILRYLREFQRSNPGELEMVNLLESHKLTQNSVTMLRRTSGARRRNYGGSGGTVKYSAQLREDAEAQSRLV
ncbi:class I SAM-dependent methyltransferase [Micromonospora sp. RTGN7]|uniref:class I SAM-dependent methyltransferase n=1 Tax=Micromonospora sp. RTGN7 TaxID=3016526 RepID=UPI0029FF1CF3|nr:class I SAM-dependent methyltransferase [Micromonospora sp. RTGN7]